MTRSVSMIIASQLSDAQHEMFGNEYNQDRARQRMNLVKILVFNYPDTSVEIETTVVDQLWEEVYERCRNHQIA